MWTLHRDCRFFLGWFSGWCDNHQTCRQKPSQVSPVLLENAGKPLSSLWSLVTESGISVWQSGGVFRFTVWQSWKSNCEIKSCKFFLHLLWVFLWIHCEIMNKADKALQCSQRELASSNILVGQVFSSLLDATRLDTLYLYLRRFSSKFFSSLFSIIFFSSMR